MKITPEHLEELRKAVTPLDTPERRERYRQAGLADMDLNKRYRWDLLYGSKLKIGDGRGMSGLPLYAYLDDTHIDTALRRIVKSL